MASLGRQTHAALSKHERHQAEELTFFSDLPPTEQAQLVDTIERRLLPNDSTYRSFCRATARQLRARLTIDIAFNLNPVAFPNLFAWAGYALLQSTIGGQDEESLGVVIQSAGGTVIWCVDELCQRRSRRFGSFAVGELTEHAKRFVEENNAGHSHSVTDLMLKY